MSQEERAYKLGSVLRVDVSPFKVVSIMQWGVDSESRVATDRPVLYDGVEVLPEWMQQKLAVLMTLPYDKPIEELATIGRRISKYVFWVYPSVGETLGPNPRSKSKGRGKKGS